MHVSPSVIVMLFVVSFFVVPAQHYNNSRCFGKLVGWPAFVSQRAEIGYELLGVGDLASRHFIWSLTRRSNFVTDAVFLDDTSLLQKFRLQSSHLINRCNIYWHISSVLNQLNKYISFSLHHVFLPISIAIFNYSQSSLKIYIFCLCS